MCARRRRNDWGVCGVQMCTVATFQPPPRCWLSSLPPRLVHLPAPLPVCVLAVCVPRVRGRRVGVSACRRVGVCLFGGKSAYPSIPFFLEKVIIYRGPPPHTSCTFTWYDGFFAQGFWSFFFVFPGYDARACPAKLKTRLDSGLKTPPGRRA